VRLIEKHRRNGLLIDANLLLLLVVGKTSEARIAKFKRTQQYTVEHFRLLRDLVDRFQPVVTTPHVLTEVSNLAALQEPELSALRTEFHVIVQDARELYDETAELVQDPAFRKLGLTDAAIRKVAERPLLVLTDDLPLYHYLRGAGLDAINFNHIRMHTWGS